MGRRFDPDRAHVMSSPKPRIFNGLFFTLFLILVTLIITPNSTLNIISAPKSFLIGTFSMLAMLIMSLRILATKMSSPRFKLISKKDSPLYIGLVIWIVALFLSTIFSDAPFQSSILGTDERKLGLNFYVSITLIAVISYFLSANQNFQVVLFFGISISACSVALYSSFQNRGLDIFNYTTVYEESSSTLGNPNFVSGFLGFAIFANFFLLFKLRSRFWLTYLIPNFYIILFALFENDSDSGKLAFVISGIFVLLIYLAIRFKPNYVLKLNTPKGLTSLTIVSLLTFLFFFFSSSGRRLTSQLVSDARTDYWLVASRMIESSPFLGHGPDTFNQYFLRYRSISDLAVISQSQISNSPHSFPLEVAQVGGFMLFSSLLIMILSVFVGIMAVCTKEFQFSNFRNGLTSLMLVGSLMAFFLQSFVNVTSIPVSVWAAALLGNLCYLITGSRMQNFRQSHVMHGLSMEGKRTRLMADKFLIKYWRVIFSFLRPSAQFSNAKVKLLRNLITAISLIVIGSLVGVSSSLSFKNEIDFKKAVVAKDGMAMIEISKRWPQENSRLVSLANSLLKEGFHRESLDLALYSVRIFPDEISLWLIIKKNPTSDEKLIQLAKQEVQRLDPLYEDRE